MAAGVRRDPLLPRRLRAPRRLAVACGASLALAVLLGTPARCLQAGGGAGPAPAPAGQEREPDAAYPPAFRARVDAAVDRGVDLLFRRQAQDGSWPVEDHVAAAAPGGANASSLASQRLGVSALMTLSCLMGGARHDDARIARAFGFMRTLPVERVYSVGVLLMALHARHAGVEGAAPEALDAYGQPLPKDPCASRMSAEDKAWMQRGVDYLVASQRGGLWRYPEGGSDLSNTQVALLGLWAASRCGLKVPLEAWMAALEAVLASQQVTGPEVRLRLTEARGEYRVVVTEPARARGWNYRGPELKADPATGAMTTAGLACLAICQDELWSSRRFDAALRTRTRKAVRDALGWLQEHFAVDRNPGQPGNAWHYYFLYGLERAGVLARSRFIGAHDWYLAGAEWLLAQQRDDGGWQHEHLVLDTAFAVLFLKRAAMRSRVPVITPAPAAPSAPAAPAR